MRRFRQPTLCACTAPLSPHPDGEGGLVSDPVLKQARKPKMQIQRCRTVAVRVREVGCMRQFLRDNGLSVTLFALFLISLVGQALTGWRAHAEELRVHE